MDIIENLEIYRKVKDYLSGIDYQELEHEPTYTSEESARVRGESMDIGAKALVLKINDQFKLCVLSAALKLDNKKIMEIFSAKKTRFATKEELFELTGLISGAVPPFSQPILPFEMIVDQSIQNNEKIAFNAGSLRRSIILKRTDWEEKVKPRYERFSL